MKNIFFTISAFFICVFALSQDNSKYFYEPFSIYRSEGQEVIAGNVNAFVYSSYYGKNVQTERYADPHVKPEYLVYELFTQMKKKNIDGVGKLYDESFVKKNFNANNMFEKTKNYSDIKFVSKFKSGDLIIVRYDFVGAAGTNNFPFFATVVQEKNGKYFLTTSVNVTDPFNVIGSFSPHNLQERKEEQVNTKNMTAFYFVRKDGKILFTDQIPPDDYAAVYFAFDYYNQFSKTPETEFLKELQKMAMTDSAHLKTLIAPDQQSLLSSDYYGTYFYAEIKKIFRNYPIILPLGSLKINDGKIVYFKFGTEDETPLHMASVILRNVAGKYYLGLRITDNDISNVLWNVYIREAIYDFFNRRP